jgi:hypothetical protein
MLQPPGRADCSSQRFGHVSPLYNGRT